MSGDHQILDVDLLAFETGTQSQRRAVIDGVRRSLQTGFVYTHHDLSESLIDQAYGLLEQFFGLPGERKDRWKAPGSNGQAGYTGLLVETAATSDVPDFKEMLNWGSAPPVGHPLRERYPHRYGEPLLPEGDVAGITEVLIRFHDQVAELQRRFLRIIACAVGAHESYFDAMLEHGATLTRAIRYPSMANSPSTDHVWAAEHGDINLITALPRATARGLQVHTDSGWIDASPPPGQVIINTGMMLERVTNGLIPTGVHRVVADPDQVGERLSVVQFLHPTPWTMLNPLVSCVTAEHPQRFSPMMAADALDEVLWQINLVEDARRVSTD